MFQKEINNWGLDKDIAADLERAFIESAEKDTKAPPLIIEHFDYCTPSVEKSKRITINNVFVQLRSDERCQTSKNRLLFIGLRKR